MSAAVFSGARPQTAFQDVNGHGLHGWNGVRRHEVCRGHVGEKRIPCRPGPFRVTCRVKPLWGPGQAHQESDLVWGELLQSLAEQRLRSGGQTETITANRHLRSVCVGDLAGRPVKSQPRAQREDPQPPLLVALTRESASILEAVEVKSGHCGLGVAPEPQLDCTSDNRR